jgi:alpha-glucosidase
VVQDALAGFDPGTWVLSNHDLTRHVTRYGGGDLGRRRGLAVSALLFALPGSPYLYQGEELGLDETDVPDHLREDPVFLRTGGAVRGRDGCRTPGAVERAGPGPRLHHRHAVAAVRAGRRHARRRRADRRPRLGARDLPPLLARRRALLPDLPGDVDWLPAAPDVLAVRRGTLVAVLNTAAEPVEVEVPGAHELLESTADGAAVRAGVVTVPAAATAWVRVGEQG